MEPARSKIELRTIPITSVDPKDQINATVKVVKSYPRPLAVGVLLRILP